MAPLAGVRRRRLLVGGTLALANAGPMRVLAGAAATPVVLVLVDDGARLLALDAVDLQLRRALALPPGPWRRLLAQPDGHALIVAENGAVARVAPGATALVAQRGGDRKLADAALGDGGRLLMIASRAPAELTLLDAATLQMLKSWPLATTDGRSGVAGAEVHDAPARRSFVVAPADLPELWEISYDPRAEDQYEGLVHDFRMGEGVPVRGHLHARRTRLPQPLHHLALDEDGLLVVGAAPGQPLQGYNLDARRRSGVWPLGDAPRPRAGVWLQRDGRLWLAVPDAGRPMIQWLNPDGQAAPPLALPAPALWLRAARQGPWLWAAAQDMLLRLDVHGGTLLRMDVSGTPLDLLMRPGSGEALLLVGGGDAALHRVDLARGVSMSRLALSRPLSIARGSPPP